MAWEDFLSNIGDFSAYQLEAEPSFAYFSSSPFGNVFNEYQGAIGTALRTGAQEPTFVDFLQDMPWTERYSALSPSLRPGGSTRRFNPTSRHMYS